MVGSRDILECKDERIAHVDSGEVSPRFEKEKGGTRQKRDKEEGQELLAQAV